jgi:hypothetical protein
MKIVISITSYTGNKDERLTVCQTCLYSRNVTSVLDDS